MKTQLRQLGLAAAAALGLALAACGGSDYNNTPPATSQVPDSASQSVGGFIDYLMKLVVSMDDTLEPVDVAAVTAPTDETSEPTALP